MKRTIVLLSMLLVLAVAAFGQTLQLKHAKAANCGNCCPDGCGQSSCPDGCGTCCKGK